MYNSGDSLGTSTAVIKWLARQHSSSSVLQLMISSEMFCAPSRGRCSTKALRMVTTKSLASVSRYLASLARIIFSNSSSAVRLVEIEDKEELSGEYLVGKGMMERGFVVCRRVVQGSCRIWCNAKILIASHRSVHCREGEEGEEKNMKIELNFLYYIYLSVSSLTR